MVPKSEKNLSLTNLDYADNVGIISDPEHAQKMLDDIVEWSSLVGLKVRTEKTKFMVMNRPDPNIFECALNAARKG